jgi:hypothetical protein
MVYEWDITVKKYLEQKNMKNTGWRTRDGSK